jgi:hypothetical protein
MLIPVVVAIVVGIALTVTYFAINSGVNSIINP